MCQHCPQEVSSIISHHLVDAIREGSQLLVTDEQREMYGDMFGSLAFNYGRFISKVFEGQYHNNIERMMKEQRSYENRLSELVQSVKNPSSPPKPEIAVCVDEDNPCVEVEPEPLQLTEPKSHLQMPPENIETMWVHEENEHFDWTDKVNPEKKLVFEDLDNPVTEKVAQDATEDHVDAVWKTALKNALENLDQPDEPF